MGIKTAIKYPGAKWALSDWIIDMFPEHHSYLEPYLGSGAVLFNKPKSNIETVNDLDDEVINLFECIKRDPERLAKEIYLTPYARKEYENAYSKEPQEDRFKKARNFCIRCNMGHGFRTTGGRVGWKVDIQGREASYALNYWNDMPERLILIAERLKEVQIESRPAVHVIQRFNFSNVLIYLDPPYLLNTRHGKQYKHEMVNKDHEELLDAILKHKGYVILSGYESDLYNSTLQGWHREMRVSRTQSMKQKTEVLWMNFEPDGQMSLTELQGMKGAVTC